MTTTCEFCEKWIAKTTRQFNNRLANMRAVPGAEVCPCPKCGGTYWASKPPLPEEIKVHDIDWNAIIKVGIAVVATLILAVALSLLAISAHAQTFRDASGKLTGTATRDANGQTTYRDGSGRMTGTASTNSNGTTTFRDGSGRMTGTAERRR